VKQTRLFLHANSRKRIICARFSWQPLQLECKFKFFSSVVFVILIIIKTIRGVTLSVSEAIVYDCMYSRDSFIQFIGRLARTGGIGSCLLLLRPESYMQRTIGADSTEAQINEFSMTRDGFLTGSGCFIKKIHDHIDGNINQPCFVQSDQQLCFNCQKIRSESHAEYKKLDGSEPLPAGLHISPNEENIPSTALSSIQRESEAMTITSSSVSAAINDSINTLEDFGFQSEHVISPVFC
jgi:hypothetical protein